MIAEQAGLSVAAVSRALRRPRGADTTSQAVHAIADALGYWPRRRYTSLRSRRTHVLGAVVVGHAAAEYGPLLRHLQCAARASGHQMLVTFAGLRSEEQCQATDLLLSRRADALLFLGDQVVLDAVCLAQSGGAPVVTVGTRHEGTASVAVDLQGLGRLAAEYVAETEPDEIVLAHSGVDTPAFQSELGDALSAALGGLGASFSEVGPGGGSSDLSRSWVDRVEGAALERVNAHKTFVCLDRPSALTVWRIRGSVPAALGGRLNVLGVGDGLVCLGTAAAPGLAMVSVSPADVGDRAVEAMSAVLHGDRPRNTYVDTLVQRGASMGWRASPRSGVR